MSRVRYLSSKDLYEFQIDDVRIKCTWYEAISSQASEAETESATMLGALLSPYYFSYRTLVLAKRQQHLRKLGRAETSWVELTRKVRCGGRKKRCAQGLGSGQDSELGSSSSSGDSDVYLWNAEHFDTIAKKCVEHDWLEEFLRLCEDVAKADVLKKRTKTAYKWVFAGLRYKYKVENGFEPKNGEYEKVLDKACEKYNLSCFF